MLRFTLCVVLGGLRVAGVTSPAFQAVAHLFVGGLFGGWLVLRQEIDTVSVEEANKNFWMAIGLSVLELVCFLWFRFVIGH